MEGWYFNNTAEGWAWCCVDQQTNREKRSAVAFCTRLACVDDATRNGYLDQSVPRRIRHRPPNVSFADL